MKRNILVLILIIFIAVSGCKKTIGPFPTPSGTTNSSLSYLPVTAGSTWTYLEAGVGNNDTIVVKITGGTTIINSKTYYNATSFSVSQKLTSPGYFFGANHVFGTRDGDASSGLTLELQVLNDTASVGYSWITKPTDDGMVNGYPARAVTTIEERNISKVIGSKTFTNVIHTKVDLQVDNGSGYQSYELCNFYFARGIGLIADDVTVFGLTVTESILSYTVK